MRLQTILTLPSNLNHIATDNLTCNGAAVAGRVRTESVSPPPADVHRYVPDLLMPNRREITIEGYTPDE